MTRWLQAARLGRADYVARPVLSVLSVLSEGEGAAATPPDLILDLYEERAAIRQYLGGQSRAEAEAAAVADVARSTGCAPLRVLRIVGGGNG